MTVKPTPPVDAWSKPYWTAAQEHRLILQFCPDCQHHVFYPRLYCPHCDGERLAWVEASGRGVVYTFTVVRNNAPSAFSADLPFVIAVVRLAEGVQMMTNIVGCDPAEVYMEMPVEVVFEKLNEAITLPKFRPVNKDSKG